MPIDPDRACPHEDFTARVEVNRLTAEEGGPITGYSADVRVCCAHCDEPFRFIGMRAGLDPRAPACSVDEAEARLPIRPASSDPDFGLGIPGFAVQVREED